MNRREFLSSAAAAVATGAPAKRPNILVLFTDDQRFDTIRALGNKEILTPAMDRLAANGTAFTHAFTMGGTHGAICVPSRAMLMSGRSLFHVHRDIMQAGAPQTFAPFPKVLADAGYQTFMTGKWHNGAEYFAKTFTQGAENVFFGGMTDQFAVEVQGFDPTGKYAKNRMQAKKGEFASTLFADSAIQFLEHRDQSRPFVLYVAFTSPHDPRTAPKRFADTYSPEKITLPPNFKPEHAFDNGELKVRDELLAGFPRKPEEVQRHIADYYAMISAVDHEMGRILQALDKSGEAANTYAFFAGDNGIAIGQHGLFGKQSLYEHSWRVPLIVTGPGVPRGKRNPALTYIMDICPTVYKVTGVPPPPGLEAQALDRAGWRGSSRKSIFGVYRNLQRAVRTDRWKLIEYNVDGRRTTQLFDLANDPWEMRNLAGEAALQNRIAELRNMLRAHMKAADDPADLDSPVWADVKQ